VRSQRRPQAGEPRRRPGELRTEAGRAAGELRAEAGRAAALAHPSLAEDGVAEIRGDGRADGGERLALGRGAGQAEMQRMRSRMV